MNNQNNLNLISKLLGQNGNNMQNGNNNNISQNIVTSYPETFFTKSFGANNMNNNTYTPNANIGNNSNFNNGGMLSNLFNGDMIKNLIPLFLGKGSSGLSNIISGLNLGENNNISQIMGLFKNNKNDKSDNKNSSQEEEKSIIDLSEFTEVT